MKIGQVIRKRRKETGMNLEQFAAIAGMDAGNLSKLERGLQSYTPDRLAAIAAALGTSPAQLLSESESSTPQHPSTDALPPEKEERDFLRHYWQLNAANRAALRQIAAAMSQTAGNHAHS